MEELVKSDVVDSYLDQAMEFQSSVWNYEHVPLFEIVQNEKKDIEDTLLSLRDKIFSQKTIVWAMLFFAIVASVSVILSGAMLVIGFVLLVFGSKVSPLSAPFAFLKVYSTISFEKLFKKKEIYTNITKGLVFQSMFFDVARQKNIDMEQLRQSSPDITVGQFLNLAFSKENVKDQDSKKTIGIIIKFLIVTVAFYVITGIAASLWKMTGTNPVVLGWIDIFSYIGIFLYFFFSFFYAYEDEYSSTVRSIITKERKPYGQTTTRPTEVTEKNIDRKAIEFISISDVINKITGTTEKFKLIHAIWLAREIAIYAVILFSIKWFGDHTVLGQLDGLVILGLLFALLYQTFRFMKIPANLFGGALVNFILRSQVSPNIFIGRQKAKEIQGTDDQEPNNRGEKKVVESSLDAMVFIRDTGLQANLRIISKTRFDLLAAEFGRNNTFQKACQEYKRFSNTLIDNSSKTESE
jgi:hypothetical protein